jgi:hypothetical protein
LIRLNDEAGDVIETHEHSGEFQRCGFRFLNAE